ncbi:MAG: hypothetical protein M3R62_09130 [Acidobacteriota bacterium]|nr:hypothetical protein [Acidobacteriota bacterium]
MEYLWCRLETAGDGTRRVHVMHPSGEIQVSLSPDRLGEALVRRIEVGQVRARLSDRAPDGSRLLTLEEEESGRVMFEARLTPDS